MLRTREQIEAELKTISENKKEVYQKIYDESLKISEDEAEIMFDEIDKQSEKSYSNWHQHAGEVLKNGGELGEINSELGVFGYLRKAGVIR